MKTIKFLFSDLNQDERQILGGVVTIILGAMFLMWLISTVKPPVKDSSTIDTQVHFVKKHELSKFYSKYANRIYNEKYGK
jgi:hypothetical protein